MLKEKTGTLPLLDGGVWKQEDIVPPEGSVACGDKFLLPGLKGMQNRWLLMDREGNECAHLDVYLFESEKMARKEFILERESFSQLGDLVVWGKDVAGERGTWCMYRLSGKAWTVLSLLCGEIWESISGRADGIFHFPAGSGTIV